MPETSLQPGHADFCNAFAEALSADAETKLGHGLEFVEARQRYSVIALDQGFPRTEVPLVVGEILRGTPATDQLSEIVWNGPQD